MEKKSGVTATSRSLPQGGGAMSSIGDLFQPNLAMGGGSYRIPIEVPSGPGGFSPRIELLYNTGFGADCFGLGWRLATPFIRVAPKSPDSTDEEYLLTGSERLVKLNDGSYAPFTQQQLQKYHFHGDHWTTKGTNLVEFSLGSTSNSRIEGATDTGTRTYDWLLDKIVYPGNRRVEFEYDEDGSQRYLAHVRWAVFRVDFEYEDRPDPSAEYRAGFEIALKRRCKRISIHHEGLAPNTLIRTYDFKYALADNVGTSLLESVRVTGYREENGVIETTQLAPLTFGYSGFDPAAAEIRRFTSLTAPPPPLGTDVTLVDLRGSGLPGVLRTNGQEVTYWENRGELRWGPASTMRYVPSGIRSGEDKVQFADLNGDTTADLVIEGRDRPGFYPNDPDEGFLPKRSFNLAPSFSIRSPDTWLLDLDGDRIADLLTFRNQTPLAFFNENRGETWSIPKVLQRDSLPNLNEHRNRIRFADMTGDGMPDLVMLRSRQIVFYPNLGHGRWGDPKIMANSPEFDVPDAENDVYLADINGDGTSDLILVGVGVIRIFLNSGGQRFADVIVLSRTPRFGSRGVVLTDMLGTGTVGILWSGTTADIQSVGYWYLDPTNGVKPYLLTSIDNGRGLTTTIEYGTSVQESVDDRDEGIDRTGYLPFAVQIVRRITEADSVIGQSRTIEYRYHNGNYDRFGREYLGYGTVDAYQYANTHEAAIVWRYYFHNRLNDPLTPALSSGKGQPYRTDLIDPLSGEIRKVEVAQWEGRLLADAAPDRPAYLTVEVKRTSRRLQGGATYAKEAIIFDYDAVGNRILEHRVSEFDDIDGTPTKDELRIEQTFASHATLGLTSFPSLLRKRDGTGRVLKNVWFYYDGPDFDGLPLGTVEKGWKTRQTEVVFTQVEINEAYGGTPPALLATLYRKETDPTLGTIWVQDTQRYRLDAFGNQLETRNAVGHRMRITYDVDGILPETVRDDEWPVRAMEYDPISQQVTRVEDLNGNVQVTRYDGLGNIKEVYNREALAGRPTEVYQYQGDVVPNVVIQRTRTNPDDVTPGRVKYEYQDGSGRTAQVKINTADGRWAVGKQPLRSVKGRRLGERDAYFSNVPDYEPTAPPGVKERSFSYDFAGRIVQEELFTGSRNYYRYDCLSTRMYGADIAPAFEADPTVSPTRTTFIDGWDRVIANAEHDSSGMHVQKRQWTALGGISRLVDPLGHTVLECTYDLLGNRIRILSADAGESTYIFDAEKNEVLRTDADGRSVYRKRDVRGRATETRIGDPRGSVVERYTYDTGTGTNLIGRLARVDGAFGRAEYSYSVGGAPVSIRRTFTGDPTTYEVKFAYNSNRDVTKVDYPDGSSISYQYHPNGMLAGVPGYINSVEYDASGRRTKVVYANGLETQVKLSEGHGFLEEILTRPTAGGQKYQHLKYHYDPIGQVIQVEDLSTVTGKIRNNQTFGYDERHRLIHATGIDSGGAYAYDYQYDDLGNMTYSDEGLAAQLEFGHHVGDTTFPNRLVKRAVAVGPEYQYDASGNLTFDPDVGTFHYDARHRLTRIERLDGGVVECVYDHNGRRCIVRVIEGGVTKERFEVEGLYIVDGQGSTKVIRDERERMAVVPSTGDPLLYHKDRLGNVNVISNLSTGAFVGHHEYAPYGSLTITIVIEPNFTFQGARFSEGVDIILLGSRYYRPALGRFFSPDGFLLSRPNKIPGLLVGANLYAYTLANPTNATDRTGQLAFLAVLVIAVVVGAILGAIGAATAGADTWDEWLMWIVGGAIGGALVALSAGGLAILFGASAAVWAAWAVGIWAGASFLGSLVTPSLDKSDSEAAWVFSFLIKWIQSPVTTTIGLIAALVVAIAGGNVDFERGMLFIEVGGSGYGAATVGAVAWTTSGGFEANGDVNDDLAEHEAYHSRQVVAMGELGFYVTYFTVGGIFGVAQGGTWVGMNNSGCGNPFEKTSWPIDHPGYDSKPAHETC